jgi:arsenite-transporting ATPase
VLLVSADPAHSLGDALGVVLGDEPRTLPDAPGNLQVREIDAAVRFSALKTQYVEAVEALFKRMVGGVLGASSDRQAMQDLLELAPPGLDELVAVAEVSDRLSEAGAAARSLIVIDTAPSGHALRLLEAPALVHDWVKALMAMLLKYRDVVGIGELGEVLLRTSKGLGRLRALLADPARTAFIAVTRPAALPVAETVRLLGRLQSLPIAAPVVIVNAIGAGACGNCAAARRAQRKAVDDLRRSLPRRRHRVVFAPAVIPPPHGPGGLSEWRDRWRAGIGTSRLANL